MSAAAHKVGIRPEHLHLEPVEQGVVAEVMLAEHLGDASIIHLRVDGVEELLTAKVSAQEGRVVAGRKVGVTFDVNGALAFSADGGLLP